MTRLDALLLVVAVTIGFLPFVVGPLPTAVAFVGFLAVVWGPFAGPRKEVQS